MITKLLFF